MTTVGSATVTPPSERFTSPPEAGGTATRARVPCVTTELAGRSSSAFMTAATPMAILRVLDCLHGSAPRGVGWERYGESTRVRPRRGEGAGADSHLDDGQATVRAVPTRSTGSRQDRRPGAGSVRRARRTRAPPLLGRTEPEGAGLPSTEAPGSTPGDRCDTAKHPPLAATRRRRRCRQSTRHRSSHRLSHSPGPPEIGGHRTPCGSARRALVTAATSMTVTPVPQNPERPMAVRGFRASSAQNRRTGPAGRR